MAVMFRPLVLESIDPLFLKAVGGKGGFGMCCFGAGRDESGCRFSGIGYADVGWLDDVAGDYRQTVGEKHWVG